MVPRGLWDKQGYARDDRQQRADHADVAEDQAGQRHAVAPLAALADPTAGDMPEDDRRDAGYEPEKNLADSAGQRGDGHRVRARTDSRVGPLPVRDVRAAVRRKWGNTGA